ncbi:Uu.00g128540.m01.CDS01 [Anthostomella pinea]|uniref:Uu.00g128540.m01.CDS01 n=1 Tax=Anthostomella pinea TaxID=933095 RepID=A0AAI8YHW4_9PEZI|nr:Uu.00g128540.m01.CDS01 [Anthostomella pinea]
MQPGLYSAASSLEFGLLLLTSLPFIPFCSSTPAGRPWPIDTELTVYSNYHDPAPAPEDGPPLSAGALRDTSYLPAQIGGIVGSYAFSLVVVAALLLLLAKKRRQHLTAGEEDIDPAEEFAYQFAYAAGLHPDEDPQYPYAPQSPSSPIKNFSYPVPTSPTKEKDPSPYIYPSFHSTSTLGVNPLVDPRVVKADREMAQQQLEEMYKHVMEQEAAKEAGVVLEQPPAPVLRQPSSDAVPKGSILKKGKNKPANLDLTQSEPEKQSRTSSFFSALKSPRTKKNVKGISISSPIMTPMSGTFPRQDGEEMNTIPPRHYAPASPPPIPGDHFSYARSNRQMGPTAPLTPPDVSPESTQSIDERIGGQLGHSRSDSQAPTEYDPVSATSERSTAPLVGLPSSPKPGVNRFSSFPASPKPGATFPTSPRGDTFPASPRGATFPISPKPGASFSRPNAPSAIRTGGALPLRAYEPAMASPSVQTTKQTTFERAPLSPSGLRTPWTGAPVPYTPYQPFSPVMPVTPSLITKADRKRMKQMHPKTPTMQMVQSSDDIW